jgi:hypothetical protein
MSLSFPTGPIIPNDPINPGAPHTGTDPGVSGNGSGVREWRLGAYWPANYPRCTHFHEDRLCFAGAPQSPDRIDMSCSSEYEVFSPTNLDDGTINDANACSFALNSNTVNAIFWMQTDQHGLVLGTAGGEWVLMPSPGAASITPTSVQARQINEYGSVAVAPLHVGKNTLYLQTGGRKLRTAGYDFTSDGYTGDDITPLAQHATVSGFVSMAVQRTPQQILWLARADGALVSCCYDDKQNEAAWAVHSIGGVGDADGNPPKVLSVDVIPNPDGTYDEVWLAVQRYINGATVVYVERMSKLWEEGDASVDENGTPRYVPDDTVYADCAQRVTNTTAFGTISGATWLEGATVGVMGDGSMQSDAVVDDSGGLTLEFEAKDVVIGFKYSSIGRTLKIEAGGADGPAQGKIQRVHRVLFDVIESAGFYVNARGGSYPLQDIPFRKTDDLMDAPTPLRTDTVVVAWEGTYDRGVQIEWQSKGMLPFNLSGMSAQLETQDGG